MILIKTVVLRGRLGERRSAVVIFLQNPVEFETDKFLA
jgi:hypothetical protein